MELDIAKLEQQLQGIYQERQVVNERLKTLGPGRGRGRGPGYVGPASFRGGPSPGRGMAGRGAYPGQGHYDQAPGSLLGLAPTGQNDRSYRHDRYSARPPADVRPSVMDRLGPSFSRDNRSQAREHDPAPVEAMAAVEPAGSRKRLSSAVVVDGQTKQLSQTDELMTAKRPKSDDTDDNPAAKKRNRRMFGFLNQTLQRSKIAQQRDEALKRAEERRREELVKFKANFKLEMATKRHTEVNLKKELNMQADVKRAEIGLVQRILRRTLLTNFIQTSAGPPLFWLPGKHNTATQSLLKKEQEKLEAYKLEEAAKVEAKRQEVDGRIAAMAREVEAAAARRLADAEAAAQRRTAAKAGAASGAAHATASDDPKAEAADEDMAAEDDEAEDGALEEAEYAVGEEEVMQDADTEAQQEGVPQRDRPANGVVQQPSNAEDDRYVATAYVEGEDQDDRVREASQEPAAQKNNPAPDVQEGKEAPEHKPSPEAQGVEGPQENKPLPQVHEGKGAQEDKSSPDALEKKEVADKPAAQSVFSPQELSDQDSRQEAANAESSSSMEERQVAEAVPAAPQGEHAEALVQAQPTAVDTAEHAHSKAA